MVIIADEYRNDLLALSDTAALDAELNDGDRDFRLTIYDDVDPGIQEGYTVYIPDSEIGGVITGMETDSSVKTTTFTGKCFRGMLSQKIIEPPSGADFKTVSGELNTVLTGLINNEFSGILMASEESTGQNVSFQFDRYCTLLDGINKMLDSVGYRLNIVYLNGESAANGYAEVSAVRVHDYSDEIELSQNYNLTFKYKKTAGYNHIIAAGKGDLKDRVIVHMYADANGTISAAKTFSGAEERTYFHDYPSADNAATLRESAIDKLKEIRSEESMEMKIERLQEINVNIGDIVGGRDYKTGKSMTAKVSNIIAKVAQGELTKEYKVGGNNV